MLDRFEQNHDSFAIITLALNPAHESLERPLFHSHFIARLKPAPFDQNQAIGSNSLPDFRDELGCQRDGKMTGANDSQNAWGITHRVHGYAWSKTAEKVAWKQGSGYGSIYAADR